jgi:hypothetical protein
MWLWLSMMPGTTVRPLRVDDPGLLCRRERSAGPGLHLQEAVPVLESHTEDTMEFFFASFVWNLAIDEHGRPDSGMLVRLCLRLARRSSVRRPLRRRRRPPVFMNLRRVKPLCLRLSWLIEFPLPFEFTC